MVHSFLLEPGRWILEGTWLERDKLPMPVRGKILIGWSRDDWFTVVMKILLPQGDPLEMALQYRGRLTPGDYQYTFMLQHSLFGRGEGEGWLTPSSIIQRYWALGDRERRTGFETLHRLTEERYHLCSGVMVGHYLTSTLDATLSRQQPPPS